MEGDEKMKLFDSTKIPLLNDALDAYQLRHKAIGANISNVNTPGYRSKQVMFEELLTNEMSKPTTSGAVTNANHIPIESTGSGEVKPQLIDRMPDGLKTNDQYMSGFNNVDIDVEMTELAKNQIRYKFTAQFLARTFRGLQEAIRGTSS
jgi:flagellar basal-body rod protein FlgB